MFEDVSDKFGKLKIPEGSLIRRLERIKISPASPKGAETVPTLFPDVVEQIRRAPDEISKRIKEVVTTKNEMIRANSESIRTLENQIKGIEQTVIYSKNGSDELKQRFDMIEKSVLELSSSFEVVSSTMSSFNSDNKIINIKISDIEHKIDELGARKSEVSSLVMDGLDNKIKGLEDSFEKLKKTVESKSIDENVLVQKVAGMVVERMNPKTRTTPIYGGKNGKVLQEQQQVSYESLNQITSENSKDEEKVRLSFIDNKPQTSVILINWIEFLMEKVGRNNLYNVLEYYIDIGWINNDVSTLMMTYASGIDYFVDRPSWKLLPEDHTKSLMFIEELRGKKLDKMVFSRFERDVKKILCAREVAMQ